MRYFIKQDKSETCGETCLKMLLANVNCDENFLYLSFNKKIDNFLDICEVGEKYGLSFEGFKADDKSAFRKIKGPLIIQIDVQSMLHFVVSKKSGFKRYLILDPSRGRYFLSEKQLWTYFTGHFLKINSYSSTRAPIPETYKKRKYFNAIASSILNLVMVVFGGIGLYYSHSEKYAWLAFLFLILAFITHLIERFVLFYLMKRFDDYVMNPKIQSLRGNIIEKLKEVYSLKAPMFSYPLIVFSRLLIALIISLVFISNDWLNAPNLLIVVLLVYLKKEGSLYLKGEELALDHNLLIISNLYKAREPFHKEIDNINKLSAKLATKRLILHYLVYAVLIILVGALMYFNKTYSLNYFLFHFFGYVYFVDLTDKLLSLDIEKSRQRQAIRHYNNLK